jgi:hypothetical protein
MNFSKYTSFVSINDVQMIVTYLNNGTLVLTVEYSHNLED